LGKGNVLKFCHNCSGRIAIRLWEKGMSLNFAIIVAGELLFAFVRGPMAEFQNIKDVPLKFCYRALQ